ncbi:hypothetical protein PILCRDRAFT_220057 [Piloderma croceum F 1598]|uniref:Uncharacterized protein n=1 Tax=Piloderma croceum (strain F 1598) TaxID=765440 RepID=A0A0C3GC47_PILCF|nr:hypothetical protein PILCRDRAFT_220057 [Piloderma croceum F 1598]
MPHLVWRSKRTDEGATQSMLPRSGPSARTQLLSRPRCPVIQPHFTTVKRYFWESGLFLNGSGDSPLSVSTAALLGRVLYRGIHREN